MGKSDRRSRSATAAPPRKVERACQHLRKDRLALKEIALLSGFSDQSHLNRIFRRQMNVTPAEYRKNCLS